MLLIVRCLSIVTDRAVEEKAWCEREEKTGTVRPSYTLFLPLKKKMKSMSLRKAQESQKVESLNTVLSYTSYAIFAYSICYMACGMALFSVVFSMQALCPKVEAYSFTAVN